MAGAAGGEVSGGTVGRRADTSALLGRAADLARFGDALALAARGQPSLVEYVGDPGIGKTRLLAAFARLARQAGVPVWCGTGNLGPHRRYGLWGSLLRQPQPDEAHLALSSVHARLAASADSAGRGVVLLDAVHECDDASLDLLADLVHDPPAGLVLVLAYRPRPHRARLTACLDGSALRRRLVVLGPLSRAETAQLAPDQPAEVMDRVFAASAGNPCYAAALLAAGPGPDDGLALAARLPDSVELALAAELAALSADERTLLRVAAVLGDPIDAWLCARVHGWPVERCVAVVDRLVARDMLRVRPGARAAVCFRHPVVRAAVYRAIPPGDRYRWHAGAAAALRDLGAPAVEVAEHLAAGAVPGDGKAIRDLVVGAVATMTADPERAVRLLRAALALLPDADLRVDVVLALARAELAAGRPAASRELLHRLDTGKCDANQAARVGLARAVVDRLLGRTREAAALLDRQLRAPDLVAPEVRVPLAVEAAVCAVLRGSPEAHRYLALAAERTTPPPDRGLATMTSVVAAFDAAYSGGIPAALPRLTAAVTTIDTLTDEECAANLDVLALLAWTEALLERDRQALRHCERAQDIGRRSGLVSRMPYVLLCQCYVGARQGMPEMALAAAEAAGHAARSLGMASLDALSRSLYAAVLAWRDGPAAARDPAEQAVRVTPARERDWFSEICERMAVRVRFDAGDPTATEAVLLRCCGDTLDRVEACTAPYWAGVLMDMAYSAGAIDRAEAWADTATRLAEQTGLAGQIAHAALARARLARARGDLVEAARLAGQAADTFAALGWPADEAGARLLRAATLDGERSWPEAEAELAEVRRLAERTGSRMLRQAAVVEQRRVGGRAGRLVEPCLAPRWGLTRREWEVARLVAGGASNADIAGQLYVTVKTVEAHLTRIFRKVGTTSRSGLAALVITE